MERPSSAALRAPGLALGLTAALLAATPARADGLHFKKERYVVVPAQRSYVPAETTRVYERRYVPVAVADDLAESSDRGSSAASEFGYGEDGKLKYLGADADRSAETKSASREAATQRVYVRDVPVERVYVREAPVERVLIREAPVERVYVREAPAEPVYLLRSKKHHWFGR
ncbi:hypothetical protein [Paludisphaera sp.]|uniref:hypothetical protein n=1 Tax=Paludisphaera sp. TaxID=2017432 RepID=UPI00301BBFB4